MLRGPIIWKKENCWRRWSSVVFKVFRYAMAALAGNAAPSRVGPIYALHVHGDVEGLRGGRQAPAQRHFFEIGGRGMAARRLQSSLRQRVGLRPGDTKR